MTDTIFQIFFGLSYQYHTRVEKSNVCGSTSRGKRPYFFKEKKRYLLLEVTGELRGQSIVINRLIRQRQKELGLN